MTNAPEYLRARDIVRLTGVSLRTARRWIEKKILASGKVGGARLVAKAELARLLPPSRNVDEDDIGDIEEINEMRPLTCRSGKGRMRTRPIFCMIECPNGTLWHQLSPCLNGGGNERE